MVRVVLDTNVIVSALLKADSNPAVLLTLFLEHRAYDVCMSKEIAAEYASVLSYGKFKKHLNQEYVRVLLARINKRAQLIRADAHVPTLIDPDDTKFLACAVAAGARYLVTGNTKHFPALYKQVKIVTPAQFVQFLADEYI